LWTEFLPVLRGAWGNHTLHWLLHWLRGGLQTYHFAGWSYADVACTLAEAHLLVGAEDEFRAFVDTALEVPRNQIVHSTWRRLEAIKDAGVGSDVREPLTTAELDFLQALPQRTLVAAAGKAGLAPDTVRHFSASLRQRGFVENDRKRGWTRTKAGTDALEAASRKPNG